MTKIENTAEEMSVGETADDTETDENTDDDADGEGEPFDGGLESDENLSEEEILALEEEARKREAKKKNHYNNRGGCRCGSACIGSAFFVPFKKDDAVYKPATVVNAGEKKQRLSANARTFFTLIQSSVEFAKKSRCGYDYRR
ncbi:MAG: hypothetical protein L6V93_01050 [Clostridiales bacterium]|nr:MAG: hypothetical protein L6V93_01050 [Clostridiales bacterium]